MVRRRGDNPVKGRISWLGDLKTWEGHNVGTELLSQGGKEIE